LQRDPVLAAELDAVEREPIEALHAKPPTLDREILHQHRSARGDDRVITFDEENGRGGSLQLDRGGDAEGSAVEALAQEDSPSVRGQLGKRQLKA